MKKLYPLQTSDEESSNYTKETFYKNNFFDDLFPFMYKQAISILKTKVVQEGLNSLIEKNQIKQECFKKDLELLEKPFNDYIHFGSYKDRDLGESAFLKKKKSEFQVIHKNYTKISADYKKELDKKKKSISLDVFNALQEKQIEEGFVNSQYSTFLKKRSIEDSDFVKVVRNSKPLERDKIKDYLLNPHSGDQKIFMPMLVEGSISDSDVYDAIKNKISKKHHVFSQAHHFLSYVQLLNQLNRGLLKFNTEQQEAFTYKTELFPQLFFNAYTSKIIKHNTRIDEIQSIGTYKQIVNKIQKNHNIKQASKLLFSQTEYANIDKNLYILLDLMFVLEPMRNIGSIIDNAMVIDLIDNKIIDIKDIPKVLPMATTYAVDAVRNILKKDYRYTFPEKLNYDNALNVSGRALLNDKVLLLKQAVLFMKWCNLKSNIQSSPIYDKELIKMYENFVEAIYKATSKASDFKKSLQAFINDCNIESINNITIDSAKKTSLNEVVKKIINELDKIYKPALPHSVFDNFKHHIIKTLFPKDSISTEIEHLTPDQNVTFIQALNMLLDINYNYSDITIRIALQYAYSTTLNKSLSQKETGLLQTSSNEVQMNISNNQYKLNEIDINYIGESLFKDKDDVSFLGAVGNGHKDIDINNCLRSNFNQLIDDNKNLVGIYNPANNKGGHWVAFVLVKNEDNTVSVFFKDSLGNNINYSWYKQLKESIENVCEENNVEISKYLSGLKPSEGQEPDQIDKTSCGIFALANANIIVNKENVTEEDFRNLKFVSQSDCNNTLRAEYSNTFNQVQSLKKEEIDNLEQRASEKRENISKSDEYKGIIEKITEILSGDTASGLIVRAETLDTTNSLSDTIKFKEFSSKNSSNEVYVGISFGIGRTLLNHNKYQLKLEFSQNITSEVQTTFFDELSKILSINEIKDIEMCGDTPIQGHGLKIADIEYNLKQFKSSVEVTSDNYYLLDKVVTHDEVLKELEKWIYNTNTEKSHYLSAIHIINDGMHHACILKAFKDQKGLYVKLIDPLSEEDSNFTNQLDNLSKSIESDLSRNTDLVKCSVLYSGTQDKNYGTCGDMCLIMMQQFIEEESATYQLTNNSVVNSHNGTLDQFNYINLSLHEEYYDIGVAGDMAA